ncbi:MAG: hypothetical protein ACKVVP_03550 [Chloroflexota bacterium]
MILTRRSFGQFALAVVAATLCSGQVSLAHAQPSPTRLHVENRPGPLRDSFELRTVLPDTSQLMPGSTVTIQIGTLVLSSGPLTGNNRHLRFRGVASDGSTRLSLEIERGRFQTRLEAHGARLDLPAGTTNNTPVQVTIYPPFIIVG